jgi:hypothetical protein
MPTPLNFSAVELGREAVFQAIFDDGLEKHAGDEGFEGVFVDFLDDIEVVAAEAGDFDIEIVVDEFEFFAQRHERFVLAEEATKNIAELEDDPARVVRIEADERGDGIERVEKIFSGAATDISVAITVKRSHQSHCG